MDDDQYLNYILNLASEIQDTLTHGDPELRSYDETYGYRCLQDATY